MIFLEAISVHLHYPAMLTFGLAVAVGAYLIGSIPSGFLIGRIKGVDLREVGSGISERPMLFVMPRRNGATWSSPRIFLKASSRVAITLAATSILELPDAILAGIIAGIFAMIGHIFPVWLGFQGRKGHCDSRGIMLGLFPIVVFLVGILVWFALFYGTRYVSVASIGAALSLPVSARY